MSNEKAFQIGQYAALKGKPRVCPDYFMDVADELSALRAWLAGYDSI